MLSRCCKKKIITDLGYIEPFRCTGCGKKADVFIRFIRPVDKIPVDKTTKENNTFIYDKNIEEYGRLTKIIGNINKRR